MTSKFQTLFTGSQRHINGHGSDVGCDVVGRVVVGCDVVGCDVDWWLHSFGASFNEVLTSRLAPSLVAADVTVLLLSKTSAATLLFVVCSDRHKNASVCARQIHSNSLLLLSLILMADHRTVKFYQSQVTLLQSFCYSKSLNLHNFCCHILTRSQLWFGDHDIRTKTA